MRFVCLLVSLIMLIVLVITVCLKEVNFNWGCGDYLSRACNASTPELAAANLDQALAYMQAHDMTSGNTGVIWKQPANDVGYWYRNVLAVRDEVGTLSPSASPLERSNVLMKLRESLSDGGPRGQTLAAPSLIAWWPHNTAIVLWGWVAILLLAGSFITILIKDGD